MATTAPLRNGPKCGAKTRSGNPCKNPAGLRTEHPLEGRCYKHGGNGGAPEGNKNAVTTGEYERLHYSALTTSEQDLYERIDTSPQAQAESNLRLISIREHRILLRINTVIAADLAQDEEQQGFGVSSVTTHKGWNVKGKVDFSVFERTSVLDTVQKLEDALTRVQALKTRAIEQLRNCLKDVPPESGGLEAIVDAINQSAQLIATREAEPPAEDIGDE